MEKVSNTIIAQIIVTVVIMLSSYTYVPELIILISLTGSCFMPEEYVVLIQINDLHPAAYLYGPPSLVLNVYDYMYCFSAFYAVALFPRPYVLLPPDRGQCLLVCRVRAA